LFEKFQEIYTPSKNVCIDESLLLWKGRLHFKQYIPLKRSRFGIKLFMLCEDGGYTYRFQVYTGKDTLVRGKLEPDNIRENCGGPYVASVAYAWLSSSKTPGRFTFLQLFMMKGCRM